MARLDRKKRQKTDTPPAKVRRPKRATTESLRKLLVFNLILTATSLAINYDKFVELAEKLKNLVGY